MSLFVATIMGKLLGKFVYPLLLVRRFTTANLLGRTITASSWWFQPI